MDGSTVDALATLQRQKTNLGIQADQLITQLTKLDDGSEMCSEHSQTQERGILYSYHFDTASLVRLAGPPELIQNV
jgi:hypothetical protein